MILDHPTGVIGILMWLPSHGPHGIPPLYMKVGSYIPALEILSRSHRLHTRSARTRRRTISQSLSFDMASEAELAELVQLGHDM